MGWSVARRRIVKVEQGTGHGDKLQKVPQTTNYESGLPNAWHEFVATRRVSKVPTALDCLARTNLYGWSLN